MSIDVNRLVNHECKASLIPSDVDSSRLRAAAQIQAHDIQSVDRSNCQETCDHRLEEPWQRADADGCVADALAGYERACKDNEVLLQSFWSDQVRRNLVRFEDIHAKWKHHPVIAQIMAEDLAAPVHTK